MNEYKIPVIWKMAGYYMIDADNLDEAREIALERNSLPDHGEFLEIEIDEDGLAEIDQ